jgi:hypothetical protein
LFRLELLQFRLKHGEAAAAVAVQELEQGVLEEVLVVMSVIQI